MSSWMSEYENKEEKSLEAHEAEEEMRTQKEKELDQAFERACEKLAENE